MLRQRRVATVLWPSLLALIAACVSSAPEARADEPAPAPAVSLGSATVGRAGGEDRESNRIGMNLWFLNDWDGSFAFVDAMKHARPWSDGADWRRPVAGVDARGWPTADASTVVCTGTPEQVNGTYKLVFKGQADVSMMGARFAVSNKRYVQGTNTTTADVTVSISEPGSVSLVLLNTRRTAGGATNTGVSDVRLYRPGYPADGSRVFTAPFLRALGGFEAIRFMDWAATNRNLTRTWAERMTPLSMARPGPDYEGPSGEYWKDSDLGVALEHQVQLCNALGADLWINIPVLADDDYVRRIALAIRYGTDGTDPYRAPNPDPAYPPLDPGLRVYVEYANEIWNFGGGFYCSSVVKELVGSLPEGHPALVPHDDNPWVNVWRYPAFRIAAISDAFRSVFGDSAMMDRVRPLLMTQQGDGQATLSLALTWLDSYARLRTPARDARSYIYGAGGSAYYGVNKAPRNQSDVDAFFAAGNYPASANVRNFGVDAVWTMNFGLKRVAYEGGMGLDGYTETGARRINLDPRMQDLLVRTHDAWSSQGGDLLVYYVLRGPHQWEFTPDIAVGDTPKLRGIDQLLASPRAGVTLGPALPGEIVAVERGDYSIRVGDDYRQTIDGQACVDGNDQGEWIALPAHADAAFSGTLAVRGAAASGAVIAVYVNGSRLGTVTLPGGGRLANSSPLRVEIPSGLVVIRLEALKGGFALCSVAVD